MAWRRKHLPWKHGRKQEKNPKKMNKRKGRQEKLQERSPTKLLTKQQLGKEHLQRALTRFFWQKRTRGCIHGALAKKAPMLCARSKGGTLWPQSQEQTWEVCLEESPATEWQWTGLIQPTWLGEVFRSATRMHCWSCQPMGLTSFS